MLVNLKDSDRLRGLFVGSFLAYLCLFVFPNSPLGMMLGLLGGLLTWSGLLGFCAVYRLLGFHRDQPPRNKV